MIDDRDVDLSSRRNSADFDRFCGWKETTNMRDVLQSSKGQTQSARDYGRDAGDYVPMLERRPRQQHQWAEGHSDAYEHVIRDGVCPACQVAGSTCTKDATCNSCGADWPLPGDPSPVGMEDG